MNFYNVESVCSLKNAIYSWDWKKIEGVDLQIILSCITFWLFAFAWWDVHFSKTGGIVILQCAIFTNVFFQCSFVSCFFIKIPLFNAFFLLFQHLLTLNRKKKKNERCSRVLGQIKQRTYFFNWVISADGASQRLSGTSRTTLTPLFLKESSTQISTSRWIFTLP